MAKGFHLVTVELQDKWYKAHRDSIGTGQYIPLWRVEDIKSRGVKAKMKHFKDKSRVVHLLSQNEVLMYMIIAWNPEITQCYEQYALPLEATLAIAKELDVKHPKYPGTNIPVIQTVDFYCITQTGATIAYAVKQKDELFKVRALEKLSIQEGWCASSEPSTEFQLVDSTDLKINRVQNLERIYRQRIIPPAFNIAFNSWLLNFWSSLSDDPHDRLAHIIDKAAEITGLPYSLAVNFFHHGLWNRKIFIDWDIPLMMEFSAQDLGVCPYA